MVPLGWKTADSATNTATQNKIFSSKDLNDIMKELKSLEDAGLLTKGVTENVKNKVKEKGGEFFGMFPAALVVVGGGDAVIPAGEE